MDYKENQKFLEGMCVEDQGDQRLPELPARSRPRLPENSREQGS